MRREVMTVIQRASGHARLAAANRARHRARTQALLRDGGVSAGRHCVGIRARADTPRNPCRVSRRPGSKAPTPCSARKGIGTGSRASRADATSMDCVGTVSISTRRAIAEYAKTGIFPEGTVFVWEAGPERGVSHEGPHTTSSTLLASLKDSTKFEGGWGFFDFGGTGGAPQAKVRALPESRGCRSCHRQSPLSLGA